MKFQNILLLLTACLLAGSCSDEDNDGAFAVVYKRTDGGYGLIEDQA